MTEPDGGEVLLAGAPVVIGSPSRARALGIAVVHQELELADALSVAENLFLGRLPGRGGVLGRRELRERSRTALDGLGCRFDPDTPVRALSVAERQVVEIARALIGDARVVFLDEPTAALSPVEAKGVHGQVRRLRDRGVGVAYISHNLDDVLAVADRVSVMRDGRKVAEVLPRETSRAALIGHILGHDLAEAAPRAAVPASETLLGCRNLAVPPRLGPVSFQVRRGEIVGFFGLLGAGQSGIAEALFGLHPRASGEARIAGRTGLPASPATAMARGLGYVPPDRKAAGLALGMSIAENILMTCRKRASRFGFVDRRRAATIAREVVARFDIRCAGSGQRAGDLSGGNQQKIVLGKWQAAGAAILLLDQPTRGVDVGARTEIYRILRQHAAEGGASLVFSTDAEEIEAACDRAYVLRGGGVTAELAGDDLTLSGLLRAAL